MWLLLVLSFNSNHYGVIGEVQRFNTEAECEKVKTELIKQDGPIYSCEFFSKEALERE